MATALPQARHADFPLGDLAVATLAWASASLGIALGVNPLWAALVTLTPPMLAYLAVGHLAGRGAVMACLASALAAGIVPASGGASPLMAASLIAMVDVAALVGGATAVRMAPVEAVEYSESGRWMSVTVQYENVAVAPRPIPASAPPRAARRGFRDARPAKAGSLERTA